ncbi:hypothetical protein [Embleya sp. NPDC001921]
MLFEKRGRVAIWLNTSFDEDNDSIGWFDHDYAEVGGMGKLMPFRDACCGKSYSKSWIDAAEAAALAAGITEVDHVFALFNYEYMDEPGPVDDEDAEEGAYFLGTFDFVTDDPRTS